MIRKKKKINSNIFGICMLSPAFLTIILLQLYPLFTGISYAFTNKRLDRPANSQIFIGIGNFLEAFKDERFYKSIFLRFFMRSVWWRGHI